MMTMCTATTSTQTTATGARDILSQAAAAATSFMAIVRLGFGTLGEPRTGWQFIIIIFVEIINIYNTYLWSF